PVAELPSEAGARDGTVLSQGHEASAESVTTRWRWPSRRIMAAVAFSAAAVAAALGVLVTQRGGSPSSSASLGPNAVGVIDPKGGGSVDETPAKRAPGGGAGGAGANWGASPSGQPASRPAPAT